MALDVHLDVAGQSRTPGRSVRPGWWSQPAGFLRECDFGHPNRVGACRRATPTHFWVQRVQSRAGPCGPTSWRRKQVLLTAFADYDYQRASRAASREPPGEEAAGSGMSGSTAMTRAPSWRKNVGAPLPAVLPRRRTSERSSPSGIEDRCRKSRDLRCRASRRDTRASSGGRGRTGEGLAHPAHRRRASVRNSWIQALDHVCSGDPSVPTLFRGVCSTARVLWPSGPFGNNASTLLGEAAGRLEWSPCAPSFALSTLCGNPDRRTGLSTLFLEPCQACAEGNSPGRGVDRVHRQAGACGMDADPGIEELQRPPPVQREAALTAPLGPLLRRTRSAQEGRRGARDRGVPSRYAARGIPVVIQAFAVGETRATPRACATRIGNGRWRAG